MTFRTDGLWATGAIGALVGAAADVLGDERGEALDRLTQGYERAFSGVWSHTPTLLGAASVVALGLTLADTVFRKATVIERREKAHNPLQAPDRKTAMREILARLIRASRGNADVVSMGDELLRGAVEVGASDVHIAPTSDGMKLTFRIQGELTEVAMLPLDFHPLLVTRLKVLSRMDTYVRNIPQDGRLTTTIDGGTIEARVSTLPTELGERVVLRLVRGGRTVPELGSLGFEAPMEATLVDLLGRPQGVMFVTGPVGSGKTTTLYSALQHIARSRARTTAMVTLEDPIELELSFATQTQINPKTGMTFASTLRSVLRQDPNVLMVGEIRDRETAEIAMQAGLTGHLLLTTVHGQSAAGVFARLIEMGIEPFILASASLGCISQRLARALCASCRREAPVESIVRDRFAHAGVAIPDAPFYEPKGCEACEGRGFAGRVPVAELLVLDEAVRSAITAKVPSNELTTIASGRGMVPLLADGLARAQRGETSLLEVLRVAG